MNPLLMEANSAPAGFLDCAAVAAQEVPIKGVPTGWHTFYAVLTGNDHMPIMPMTMTAVKLYVAHPHEYHQGPSPRR